MASRQAQTGFVQRTYTPDQIFSLESVDARVFDNIVAAVNKGNLQVAQTVFTLLQQKRDVGYILTPLTEELYRLAQVKLGRSPRVTQ